MNLRNLWHRLNDLPELPEEGGRGLHLSWLGCMALALGAFGCWFVVALLWVGG